MTSSDHKPPPLPPRHPASSFGNPLPPSADDVICERSLIKKKLKTLLLQSQASGDSINWGKENAP